MKDKLLFTEYEKKSEMQVFIIRIRFNFTFFKVKVMLIICFILKFFILFILIGYLCFIFFDVT